MTAQRANLSVSQSGISCIGMTAMPEARESNLLRQSRRVGDLRDNPLHVPDRITGRCCPREVNPLFRIGLLAGVGANPHLLRPLHRPLAQLFLRLLQAAPIECAAA